jgi:cell division protein FtsQ
VNARTLPLADDPAPSLPRAFKPALAVAALFVLAVALAPRLGSWLDRPVRELRIVGALTHLTPAELAAAAGLRPGVRWWTVDLTAVRARVQALPWVAQAQVTRRWPDVIELRVWQRRPYARWGADRLLDDQGVLFAPPPAELQRAEFAALPRLSGPPGREVEVMQDYQRWASALAGTAFAPAGLSLDARGSWTLTLADGVELRLGEGDALAKLPLLTGVVLRTLADRLAEVAYVDLRYSNGFAVGWASPCAGAAPEASPARANAAPQAVPQRCRPALPVANATGADRQARPMPIPAAAAPQEPSR